MVILVLQIIITELTRDGFEVNREGLTISQWGICIGFGAFTIVVDFLIKLVPDKICSKSTEKESNE